MVVEAVDRAEAETAGEAEFIIFSNLQGNRCSIFNDLKAGFAMLRADPSKQNYHDFQVLVREVSKIFQTISNDVKEISLENANHQKYIDEIQKLEAKKLGQTVKMMQLMIEDESSEIDRSVDIKDLEEEIKVLEEEISEHLQDMRIEIFG